MAAYYRVPRSCTSGCIGAHGCPGTDENHLNDWDISWPRGGKGWNEDRGTSRVSTDRTGSDDNLVEIFCSVREKLSLLSFSSVKLHRWCMCWNEGCLIFGNWWSMENGTSFARIYREFDIIPLYLDYILKNACRYVCKRQISNF